ncbi:MAG: nucleotide exchange factor GrpE, partial [Syntrophothermus sp.]
MKENSKDMQDMPAGEDLEKEQIKEQTGDPAEDMKDKNHPKHKHKKEEAAEKTAEEIAELKDKYLRLFSEYDNYRKRTLKEKLELTKTASADVITSLLPVLDDFERAIKSLEDSGET